MLKTTWRSDLSWSAIFGIIVYWKHHPMDKILEKIVFFIKIIVNYYNFNVIKM